MVNVSGELRVWFQTVAFILIALAAWRFGGGPERILAGILLWFRGADWVNHALFHAAPTSLGFGHVLIDVLALAVALAVALQANRVYPLWFAAFQLLAVVAHLARWLAPDVAPLAYAMMYTGPSYCQMLLLTGGIWLHHRRVRRFGPYRAWRSYSPLSPERLREPSPNG